MQIYRNSNSTIVCFCRILINSSFDVKNSLSIINFRLENPDQKEVKILKNGCISVLRSVNEVCLCEKKKKTTKYEARVRGDCCIFLGMELVKLASFCSIGCNFVALLVCVAFLTHHHFDCS